MTVRLERFSPAYADALTALWRESFEHGVGVRDPHPIAAQVSFLLTELPPKHDIRMAFLDRLLVGFVVTARGHEPHWDLDDVRYEWARAQSVAA